MHTPPQGGGIKRWCVSDVCLSRTSGLRREQRQLSLAYACYTPAASFYCSRSNSNFMMMMMMMMMMWLYSRHHIHARTHARKHAPEMVWREHQFPSSPSCHSWQTADNTNRFNILHSTSITIIIFIHQISGRHQYKKCNKKTKLIEEQPCNTRSYTRPHVHWRTRESKPTTPYITLQWQVGNKIFGGMSATIYGHPCGWSSCR